MNAVTAVAKSSVACRIFGGNLSTTYMMFRWPPLAMTLEPPTSAMKSMRKMENSSVKAKEKLVR